MIAEHGSEIRDALSTRCDAVVVGSGPAGAAVARTLAREGMDVVVLEEGPMAPPQTLAADSFSAMTRLYRDMGASLTLGLAPIPYEQGCAVGGTSVVNGAISWRLPRDVHAEWVEADPALGDALPWEALEDLFDEIERDLNILPTEPEVSGANNELLGKGAEALGLAHRPIARNARGCRGLGRCLQGCPIGAKTSMDLSYLPEAARHGARIFPEVRIDAISVERSRAVAVSGKARGGGRVTVRADRAVILAASAVQTPVLLRANRIRTGPVGDHFTCHPGVSMAGRFAEPVRIWTGATQGHEVTGLRREGIKFEALGYDMTIAGGRLKGVGRALADQVPDLPHWANWGAAIRAKTEGRVRSAFGMPLVFYGIGREDMIKVRRAVRVLGEMMLAAGAEYVTPGVHGWHPRVADRATMARFEEEGPLSPRAYTAITTHLFGTCRMGSDPTASVVRPDFRHHAVDRLYVADSSVFPSNIGVNPQTSILALATMCARAISDAGR